MSQAATETSIARETNAAREIHIGESDASKSGAAVKDVSSCGWAIGCAA